jgi:hypothetical protein
MILFLNSSYNVSVYNKWGKSSYKEKISLIMFLKEIFSKLENPLKPAGDSGLGCRHAPEWGAPLERILH